MSELKQKIESILNESTGQEFAKKVEQEILKIFPKSWVQSYLSQFGGAITVRFAIGQKKDWANGILQNDPLFSVWSINGIDKDKNTTSNMTFEKGTGLGLRSKDSPYMSDIKFPFRKVKGDEKKILMGVKKYFIKVKDILKKNVDNLNKEEHPEMIKTKI